MTTETQNLQSKTPRLSPGRVRALRLLTQIQVLSPRQIGTGLSLSHANACNLLAGLEELGLTRHVSGGHQITSAGRLVLSEHQRAVSRKRSAA